MARQEVNSSNVRAFDYDPSSLTLEVEFHSGHTYRYSGVPQAEVDALTAAESKGGFLRERIMWQFPYEKVG